MRELGAYGHETGLTKATFLSKVYGLLFAAVLLMASMGVITYYYIPFSRGLYYTFLWAPLALLFIGMFTASVPGLNLLLFMAFAVLDGGMLGFLARAYVAMGLGAIFAQAAILTLIIFGGLSAYVYVTKKDFSYMGTWLFVALLVLLGASIVGMFVASSTLQLGIAIGGTVLFVLYIMYDTSRIIHSKGLIDPVWAAWMLFIDLVNLFLYILRLLTILSGDE